MRMRKNNLIAGFTIVELMVAMVLLLIIMAALIPQIRAIRSSWATTQKSSELIQNALVLEEHLNRNLAAAKQILAVSSDNVDSGYITFTDNLGVSKTYSVANGYIAFGDTANPQLLAGPVTKFKISCYSLNDFDTPVTDANSIRFVKIETDLTNSESSGTSRNIVTQIYVQTGKPSASGQEVIDVMVNQNNKNTAYDFIAGSYGCDAVMEISKNSYQALLCFKDIVGDANWQIPLGTEISEATLKLWYVNHNGSNNINIYRMNVDWSETSTWNSIGGGIRPGINCDSASALTMNPGNGVPTSLEIDVTDIVKGWINGEYLNYGFGFVNDKNNNLQFAATENTTGTNAHTPKLIIKQQTPDTRPKVAVKDYVSYGGSNAIFDSYNSSSGFYSNSNVSQNAVVTANAIGYNIITLYSHGKIYGDAYIGPGGNTSIGFSTWGSTITGIRGTLDTPIDFPNPTAPTGSPFDSASEGDFPTNDWTGGERIISSNHHYNSISIWSSYITINGDVTLLLDGDLNVGSGRSIRIASGSSLNLYVKGSCSIGGSLNAYNEYLPSNMRIYMLGSNKSFSTWGSGDISAMIDNPNGPVSFWGWGDFFGRIKCKSLSGSSPIHVDLDSTFENGGGSAGGNKTWTFSGGNSYQGIAP
ncbi:MAG: DNRLRE domain-containing protein [Planctomycetaceae bacterium]|nr:DNRLRE domain-containing protein [Planctomycetaceae bacterium]